MIPNSYKTRIGKTLVACMHAGNSIYDFVEIKNFNTWDNAVEIKTLIDKLTFVRNKRYWGVYLQRGITKITRRF